MARLADPELPSYQASVGDDDADMGAQLPWSNQETLHNSIEGDGEDEGIGLTEYDTAGMAGMTSVLGATNWSFNKLNSKAGSDATGDDVDVDIASDVAQNDGSSVNDDDDDDDDDIFELGGAGDAGDDVHLLPAEAAPGGAAAAAAAEYVGGPSPDPLAASDLPPSPSVEAQDYMGHITAQAWAKQQQQQMIHTVPPPANLGGGDADDRASDKVAEIHVGDGDEQSPLPVTGPSSHA